MTKVRALVLTGYGLNCDNETAYAFELAGAKADRVHINSLIDGSASLDDYQILAFGGGFSWGDDHGAGVIQAVRMKSKLGDRIVEFIEKGNLILGICNGFQALVNLGLLPGFECDYRSRSVSLTYNDCGNFRNDWVTLTVNSDSPCVFTRGIDQIDLPVRHGEGKFYAKSETIERLIDDQQVVFQYALPDGRTAERLFPFNPNGSIRDIAGICDPTGRVLGLMPHPEAYNHVTNYPNWTRRKEILKRSGKPIQPEITPGINVFKNAIAYLSAS